MLGTVMARPREFNSREALDRAMQVFWTKGYEAASLCDLTEAMGLSKSSLYDSFGNKHELYLAALDRYNRTVAARDTRTVIAAAGGGRRGVEAVFARRLEAMVDRGETRGCFIGNCAVETGANDPAGAARVAQGVACLEQAFADAVREGQTRGEIANGDDADALARYLTSSLNGLIVIAKVKRNRDALEDVVRLTLGVLD